MGKFVIQLSNSAVDRYNECSLCYKIHYLDRIRPVQVGSALIFGGAIDKALNILLLTKDLEAAKKQFFDDWFKVDHSKIRYSKSDVDEELLAYFDSGDGNLAWQTLYFKAQLFLEAYHKEVLPKIKKVIAVQEPITIKNSDGDEITGFLDLVVEWEDGKTYLLDNKTSSVKYSETAAKDGQQLPLYYFGVKDIYKIDGIGYIVLSKKINKNKVKKCKSCRAINTGSHKKCNSSVVVVNNKTGTIIGDKRCNGEFEITMNPSIDLDYIFNQVEESDEDRVLEAFDKANFGITNEIFETRHNPVRGKFGYCPYSLYTPDSPDFYKLPERKT